MVPAVWAISDVQVRAEGGCNPQCLLCSRWSMSTPAALGCTSPFRGGRLEGQTQPWPHLAGLSVLLSLLAGQQLWDLPGEDAMRKTCAGPAQGMVILAASYACEQLVGVFNAHCWPVLLGCGRWPKILRCGTGNHMSTLRHGTIRTEAPRIRMLKITFITTFWTLIWLLNYHLVFVFNGRQGICDYPWSHEAPQRLRWFCD